MEFFAMTADRMLSAHTLLRPVLTLFLAASLFAAVNPTPARAATIGTTAPAVFYVGSLGAASATQVLNGIIYTEGQIGVMADRILLTQLQIGAMANRIVYVTQMSQTNSIVAIYALSGFTYLGLSSAGYSYSATLTQVPTLPLGW
jgi:hypothetical protein